MLAARGSLSMVLVKVMQPESDFASTSWRNHVRPTLVCSLWRTIAMQTPAYWSCIPFDARNHIAEVLSRTKIHPLSIRLRVPDHDFKTIRIRAALREHLPALLDGHRLEELHVDGELSAYGGQYLEHFPHDKAPQLRSLSFSSTGKELSPSMSYHLHHELFDIST